MGIQTGATGQRSRPRSLRVVVIGAGMAGIAAAIKLREAGFDDFVVYEKADRLGGTWRENRYPGLTCDVPSHLYSYSFAPNPDWSQTFAPGPEILAYFEEVARRYGVVPHIQFGKEIATCRFEDGRWRLAMKDGSRDEADFVIAATGVLHHPAYPDIDGAASFRGRLFHSARWDPDVDCRGKKVGIVGTGATSVQIAGALVDQVEALTVFQRTPQWIMPVENPPYDAETRAEFRRHPEAMAAIREEVRRAFTDGFANILVDLDSPILEAIHVACENHLEASIADPSLREKLRPTYRAACKRLVMSGTYYAAITRPNASVVTTPIARIEERGIRTADGTLHELDVLVLATGFQVDRFLRPMEVVGRDGTRLDDSWSEGPTAYMAISVPDFPNLFLLNGPNGPVGNFSLIDVAERQIAYVLQLIERVRSGNCREVSVSRKAMARFDAERRIAAKKTIWGTGCKSWYLDGSGLPTAWPWTFTRFLAEMEAPRLDDFDLR